MKRSLFVIYLITFCLFTRAQDKIKLYFNKNWEITTKDKATYIREACYDLQSFALNGKVADYDLAGNPMMEGNYLYGKRNGNFIFYYGNGVIESHGSYLNDKRVGQWLYNYSNGQVKQSMTFNGDEKEVFTVKDFYNRSGKMLIKNGSGKWMNDSIPVNLSGKPIFLKITGSYKNGLKNGLWKEVQIPNKRILATERFRKGTLKSYKIGVLKNCYGQDDIPSRMESRLYQEMRSGIAHETLIGDASVQKLDDLPWIKGKEDAISSVNAPRNAGTVTVLPEGLGTKYNIQESTLVNNAVKINKLEKIKISEEAIDKLPDNHLEILNKTEWLIIDKTVFPKSLFSADLETFFKTISPTPINITKRKAMFPKGNDILLAFISQNLKYPPEEKKKNILGTVFVNVTIDSSGFTKDIRVLKGINDNLDEEAKRVLACVKKWLPAIEDGTAIESTLTIPVKFDNRL